MAITLLPAAEASLYACAINTDKNLENEVINREAAKKRTLRNSPDFSYKEQFPYTWKLFHSPDDNEESLTPISFQVMERILKAISEYHNM